VRCGSGLLRAGNGSCGGGRQRGARLLSAQRPYPPPAAAPPHARPWAALASGACSRAPSAPPSSRPASPAAGRPHGAFADELGRQGENLGRFLPSFFQFKPELQGKERNLPARLACRGDWNAQALTKPFSEP